MKTLSSKGSIWKEKELEQFEDIVL